MRSTRKPCAAKMMQVAGTHPPIRGRRRRRPRQIGRGWWSYFLTVIGVKGPLGAGFGCFAVKLHSPDASWARFGTPSESP